MFKKILLVVGALLAVFLVIVALQSPDFRVTRSATVAAPPATVFAQVNDLHAWQAWSPWEKIDPAMKRTYSGPPAGPGASYGWAGNREVGEGRMTITESRPGELIRFKLEFLKPFEANHDAEFVFKPEGNRTAITWTMTGKKNFLSKAMCMFVNMDKMVGGDFEKGLAALKTLAESAKK